MGSLGLHDHHQGAPPTERKMSGAGAAPPHLGEVSVQPVQRGRLDAMLAGGDHHEVAGGAQALQSLVRAWNCLDARRKVAAAEELVHTLVALVRGTAPDLRSTRGKRPPPIETTCTGRRGQIEPQAHALPQRPGAGCRY
jgi:hypothetical protein